MIHSKRVPVPSTNNVNLNYISRDSSQTLRQRNLAKQLILKIKRQDKILATITNEACGSPMNNPIDKTTGSIFLNVTRGSNAIKGPPKPGCERVNLNLRDG
ncbi:hypothetical protein AAZV13_10G164200 [Glycine max]